MMGDRLATLVSFERLKVAAGCLLLSPQTPLIFMGEEYGEENPFLYFVSHGDNDLIETVSKGRKAEFASFGWTSEPIDPQDESTFLSSKLTSLADQSTNQRVLNELYQTLISLRQSTPAIRSSNRETLHTQEWRQTLQIIHSDAAQPVLFLVSFSDSVIEVPISERFRTYLACKKEGVKKQIDSSEARWRGPGSFAPEKLTEQSRFLSLSPNSLYLFF